MIYSDPRPYMKYNEVSPIDKCNKAYGKPSGEYYFKLVLYLIKDIQCQQSFYMEFY